MGKKDLVIFSSLVGGAVFCFTFAALCMGFAPIPATLLATSVVGAGIMAILIVLYWL